MGYWLPAGTKCQFSQPHFLFCELQKDPIFCLHRALKKCTNNYPVVCWNGSVCCWIFFCCMYACMDDACIFLSCWFFWGAGLASFSFDSSRRIGGGEGWVLLIWVFVVISWKCWRRQNRRTQLCTWKQELAKRSLPPCCFNPLHTAFASLVATLLSSLDPLCASSNK